MDEPAKARLDMAALTRGLFTEGEAASAGLEVGDPRLDAITDAAFKSDYAEAAALAQAVWASGVRDIRIIGYLVYGYYLEKDIGGLAWLFSQLTAALTSHWEAIGPANKHKSADGGLNWLFQTLVRQLGGHEKLKDETYQRWMTETGQVAFDEAVKASGELLEAVGQKLPSGKCLDKLRNLDGWLREQRSSLRSAGAERQKEAERAAAVAQAAQATAAKSTAAAAATTAAAPSNGAIAVEGAAPLGLLIRKIRLFEQLITRGDLQKAAVVARDVDQLVQSFDPIVFLPKLFVPFFRLMSRNMTELEPLIASLEMPTYKSLVQLYQADLDAFAES
jgi:hypothetical protein